MLSDIEEGEFILQKRIKLSVSVSVLVILAGALYAALDYWNLLPRKSYMAKDFGIETIYSSMDYNQNGEEDYLSRTQMEVTGHYRFDASLIDEEILAAWTEGKVSLVGTDTVFEVVFGKMKSGG